ncbi:hypothetical protein MJG53_012135 [Ovis ammon polii x Ovis aries]|uniref:Uncharacterized protein n=1 Tax=Ovis ammon polii x Ovis aries TaxID=2918886 RepID=A0ACB9UQR9_9CETA|nr:hypothetical protein MJG53_012135 [Ovis ammon polii x Ovis aries]
MLEEGQGGHGEDRSLDQRAVLEKRLDDCDKAATQAQSDGQQLVARAAAQQRAVWIESRGEEHEDQYPIMMAHDIIRRTDVNCTSQDNHQARKDENDLGNARETSPAKEDEVKGKCMRFSTFSPKGNQRVDKKNNLILDVFGKSFCPMESEVEQGETVGKGECKAADTRDHVTEPLQMLRITTT